MVEHAPLHSRRVRAWLAAAAVGVLVAGYLLRPRAELPAATIEEQPSPILREVVERREAAGVFAALQQTARDVVRLSARLRVPARPLDRWSDWQAPDPIDAARFGVAIDATHVLGDAADLQEGSTVEVQFGDGRSVLGSVLRRYPAARLALIAVSAAEALPVPAAASSVPAAGELVVGVAPGNGGPVTVPLVVAETEAGVMHVASEAVRYVGVPVFTAGGEWLGVLAAGAAGTRILGPAAVLSEPIPAPPSPPVGLSLRVAPAEAGGTPEIVIEGVAPDGPAAQAGVRAGDVLVEIDGQRPEDLEAAAAALGEAGSEELRIRVRRGTRRLLMRLAVEDASR